MAKPKYFKQNPSPVSLCLLQIPQGLPCELTRAFALRSPSPQNDANGHTVYTPTPELRNILGSVELALRTAEQRLSGGGGRFTVSCVILLGVIRTML
jgi:hypothetical protein